MPMPALECECPFYKRVSNHQIYCESEIAQATTVFAFKNYRERQKYFIKYCCSDGGKKCLHYRYVASLYERGVLE